MDKIAEIKAWLQGPRNYDEGVALYERYGLNRMLRRKFAIERTAFIRDMLVEELRKIAGITTTELARLPRRAARAVAVVPSKPRQQAPAEVKEKLRFRERFPFLNAPDCPDEVKVMVADMFTAYGAYHDAFSRLQELPDDANGAKEAQAIVENYLADRQMWEALEYFKAHNALPQEEVKASDDGDTVALMTDMELADGLRNARSNVSKKKAALKKADTDEARAALLRWEQRRDLLEAETQARKKK